MKQLQEQTEAEKLTRVAELKKRSEQLKNQIMQSNGECEDIQHEFNLMQRNSAKMIKLFKHSKFYLSVASNMGYDENTLFNESNVIHYLAELEEYIASLITYVAFKRDDPNAAISSVPLEKLN